MNHFALIASAISGFWALGYTASYYAGRDNLATAVTAVMFAAFSAGVAELFIRRREIDALAEELRSFEKTPEQRTLEQASPSLRSLLWARLDRTPVAPPQAIFAPYLVGVLVMLGLLGTFLGLFGTLRGAHQALSASSDVQALRAGLTEPMRGLMRSFGTSAAGVSTSTLLGFAALFTRRAGARLSSALDRVAAGPLARLSPARRQLDALEELSEQGKAMPKAADALLRAAEGIERLEKEMADKHETSIARVEEGLSKLSSALDAQLSTTGTSLGERIASAAQTTAAKLEDALGPIARSLDESSKAILHTFGDELAKVAELEQKRGESLARLSETVREELLATASSLQDGIAEGLRAQNLERERVTSLAERLDGAARELGAGAAAHAAALAEVGLKLGEASQASTEAVQVRAKELVEALESSRREQELASKALAEKLEAMAETRDQSRSAAERQLLETLAEQGRAEQAAREERDRTLLDRLEELQRSQAALREANERAWMDAFVKASEASARDRKSAEAQLLAMIVEAHREAASMHADSEAKVLQSISEAEERAIESRGATEEKLLGSILEANERATEARQQAEHALVDKLESLHQRRISEISELLHEQLEKLGSSLASSVQVLEEASGLVLAGGTEMSALAEAFAASVTEHREAARTWLDDLGRVEEAVARTGEAAAADALEEHLSHTHEIFDRQLRFQRELFDQLRALRTPPSVILDEADEDAA